MNRVVLIGMGPGDSKYLTEIAKRAIGEADYILGASRLLESVKELCKEQAQNYALKKIEEALTWVDIKQREGTVAILVSGDVLYYSLAGTIERAGYSWQIEYIPGIGSYQLMAAKCKVTLEEAGLCSVHGRNESEGYVICQTSIHNKTFFLCSQAFSPQKIANILCNYNMEAVKFVVGSYLGQEKEYFEETIASEAAKKEYAGFSVVYVENPHAKPLEFVNYLSDDAFIRGKVPMTKEEVRVLLLHKMKIRPWDILWDLGAGTGSVSIELARHAPYGEVYAVEYKDAAVDLIEKNKEKFQCNHLTVIKKRMKDAIHELPAPDGVFFGGNEGELPAVIKYLKGLHKKIHVVMTAVTMETLAEIIQMFGKEPSFNYMQVQIGQSKVIGNYHTTQMNHPIWIMEVDIQ